MGSNHCEHPFGYNFCGCSSLKASPDGNGRPAVEAATSAEASQAVRSVPLLAELMSTSLPLQARVGRKAWSVLECLGLLCYGVQVNAPGTSRFVYGAVVDNRRAEKLLQKVSVDAFHLADRVRDREPLLDALPPGGSHCRRLNRVRQERQHGLRHRGRIPHRNQ